MTFLSILASDAIAVPLAPSFPRSELQYIIEHSQPSLFLSMRKFEQKAADVLKAATTPQPPLRILDKIERGAISTEHISLERVLENNAGLMLYTSGTTSRPKGVVLSDSMITAQVRSLIEAWKYTPSDHLLHVLPLHHIHGVINALVTPLVAGCTVEFASPFNAEVVWKRLAAPFMTDESDKRKDPITFFTVVPTVYNRLLKTHPELEERVGVAARKAISPNNMRLNISGSAALPTSVKSAWTELSHGNVLLERYGMTEAGMALSCGLSFEDRIDGSVGWPLPLVQVRLVEQDTGRVIQAGQEADHDEGSGEGEIQLRGPTIFSEYWRDRSATSKEFVDDPNGGGKWFKTGDIAYRRQIDGTGQSSQPWAQGPMYFIKGRGSVDIIKTGGEKVYALEVERELLSLPQIAEAAVIGLDSEPWGQKVAAVVVLEPTMQEAGKSGRPWGIMDMRRALRDRLVNYKLPQELKIVQSIPRNVMGKSKWFLFLSLPISKLTTSSQQEDAV